MLVLGIETSCDETAAALVTPTGEVVSEVVHSQIASFIPYGGVVPEIAARDHAVMLPGVINETLKRANVGLAAVDAIAVTHRPGLMGALLVGLMTAKGLAWSTGKPLIGVDHLVGHLLAIFLQRPGDDRPKPAYPFVALLVSGGHTALYRVEGPDTSSMRELGATRDDAAGEAFDKVAKLLGLGYPGGPVIDRLAREGDADRSGFTFKPTLGGLEMSFSGLKSALARHVEERDIEPCADAGPTDAHRDLAAAFQKSIVRILVQKALLAASQEGLPRIVLGGGVAANTALSAELRAQAAKRGLEVFVPPLASCTDNAAMIAFAGAVALGADPRTRADALTLAPNTRSVLLSVTRKGGGPRVSRGAS